ncbi:MAG TPA: hypothetical protein VJT73_10870 [Polyangiaceae bacterium]|nr:hypothetical protein [Polyangiaceae bacterium]
MKKEPREHRTVRPFGVLGWIAIGLIAGGCTKAATDGTAGGSASSTILAPSPGAAPAKAPAEKAEPAKTGVWTGSFTAKVGAVDPPKAAKEKQWTDDPGSVLVGMGTIELSVTDPGGEARGETKGALGDMTITGVFDGQELRANLLPKDPKADGSMTGFMLLKAEGPGALRGRLRTSNANAKLVREASVDLAKK